MDPVIIYMILDVQRLLLVHRNCLLMKSHTDSEPLLERVILSRIHGDPGDHVLHSGSWGQGRMSFPLLMKFKIINLIV